MPRATNNFQAPLHLTLALNLQVSPLEDQARDPSPQSLETVASTMSKLKHLTTSLNTTLTKQLEPEKHQELLSVLDSTVATLDRVQASLDTVVADLPTNLEALDSSLDVLDTDLVPLDTLLETLATVVADMSPAADNTVREALDTTLQTLDIAQEALNTTLAALVTALAEHLLQNPDLETWPASLETENPTT